MKTDSLNKKVQQQKYRKIGQHLCTSDALYGIHSAIQTEHKTLILVSWD